MPPATSLGSLTIRKIADKSEETRQSLFDPQTGEPILNNPATPGISHEAWPLAGIEIVGDPPASCRISTGYLTAGIAERWLTVEGHNPVVVPSGPEEDPWRQAPHVFREVDSITFKTITGDVTYSVTHQPGKYDDPDEASGKRVDWFYDLALEG